MAIGNMITFRQHAISSPGSNFGLDQEKQLRSGISFHTFQIEVLAIPVASMPLSDRQTVDNEFIYDDAVNRHIAVERSLECTLMYE